MNQVASNLEGIFFAALELGGPSFRGHTGLVSSLAFSAEGQLLVSGSRDTTVKVWDLTTLIEVSKR
jgi:WD40 repeat protein